MKKIISGIKSSGIPHLGNIISVIIPTISYIKNNSINKYYIMIADLHSLTLYKKKDLLINNIYVNAAIWLAFNINYNNNNIIFYRQSDIKEITELFWYLNCFYPLNRLKLFHSIKNYKNYNLGIINYPILMASDILLYNIDKVIIGIDQNQHIEITRKIAKLINNKLNKKIFNLPKSLILKNEIIPGIDGRKMSKSLGNIINIFSSKDILEKQIMSIYTVNKNINNISYNEIKNTILLKIYKYIADFDEYLYIKQKIKNNKIGFYNIKKKLLNYILFKFYKERKKFLYYIDNKEIIKKILLKGYKKNNLIAKKRIGIIYKELGFKI
ncbi:MAG: tryptophan--tRNA ligase [Candidatus Shikimatogenerans bostrichidophilus]|nr:MAG: tryptophan--tRNA ligase [Candidatus Shikimatogenerans bostrichidophilus]